MDLLCLMRYFFNKLLTSLFINRVPWSLISLLSIPNRVMMCLRMKLETAALMAFFKGTTFTYFVKCLLATRIDMWPLKGGLIGLMRSRHQVWKGHGVVISYSVLG